ncbi:hypothetical protein HYPSUDRAFT_580037 [Hypholoma sublateritium FD-334 SS-4]|uniref:F-box domain-containing protein n=1 Tax=Hypholoma sublateritium (strain FD-334 SS-4) TaxID=945553 RepID=A0A0D2L8H7_HYPSF|nr:hypothetical protein HYPSUDRAFT_580037 [Hypholoma sublateritium FD-334 SS-4]
MKMTDAPLQIQTASKLAVLPPELLTEVLTLLTWKDILQMRCAQTCRLLAGITRTRAIWARLVMECISSAAYPPRLERPIDMYTSDELEHLFLLWSSADVGWRRSDARPARARVSATRLPEKVHLVPGGRWLLVTSVQTGAVTYYDLDAETISGVLLIPDQIVRGGWFNLQVAIDFHDESPVLSFTIALSLSDRSQDPNTFEWYDREIIQIWTVGVLLNESQKAVGLEARQLAYFPHRPMITTVLAISLLGSTIAFRAFPPGSSTAYTYVVDWVHANQNPTMYAWRMLNPRRGSDSRMHLLPNSRLLILRDRNISLFDYSTIPETTDMAPQDEDSPWLDYTWTVKVSGFEPQASSIHFLNSNSARLVFIADDILHSMIIDTDPHFPTTPPPIVALMDASFLDCRPPALGCNRGILVDHEHRAWLMHYALPNADGTPGQASYIQKHISAELTPSVIKGQILDEQSGRVVIPDNFQMTVVDFALVFS